MFGFIRGLLLGCALIGLGWLGGSIFPAPAAITAPIAARAPDLAARLGIAEVTLERLRGFMSEDQLRRLRNDASELAAAAGEATLIERDEVELAEQVATLPNAPAVPVAPVTTASSFDAALYICPAMVVSNAPPADPSRRVRGYSRFVDVQGRPIAMNPTLGACLSSAFGPRGRGTHQGLDFHSAEGGPILAAGAGAVIERKFRDDFGNMVLIDHGGGVYTRYAHLSSFAEGVIVGSRVEAGQRIGLMGNTASYPIPIHLHYELLLGDYNNPRASFGLTPRSPFEFSASD